MSRSDDDSRTEEVWREIVANYGERASVSEGPPPAPEPAPTPYVVIDDTSDDESADLVPPTERFVPPPPPPVPRPATWQRGVAWAGLFVAPAIALLLVVAQVSAPSLVGWGLVAWFVGGFGYLVATMPPGPREPWDDGSRI